MRKLASIQRISNIRPIQGADKIVAADVLGWTVVTLKDEFKAGDLAVYFEIDSWLDGSNPAFASFENRFTNWGKKRGMRLRTIKLRKQISQGLLMPIEKFKELSDIDTSGGIAGARYLEEGTDLTEILKIEKWEHEDEARSNAGGVQKQAGTKQFPSFIRKTDQERVQNCINQLSTLSDETFEVSIKLDGCFGYNTYIKTWDGGTVKIGDIVKKGLDPVLIGVDSDGKCVPTRITNRFNNGPKTEWVDLKFEPPRKSMIVGKSGRLRLTKNHKVFRPDFTEVSAGDLKTGDKILFNIDAPSESVVHYVKSALLGDGSVCGKYGKSNRFIEGHLASTGYDNFVSNALGETAYDARKIISGYGSEITQIATKSFQEFDEIRKEWYKAPGVTNLPDSLEWMDDFSVAKWYIDDGSLAHNETQNDRALFATNGFTQDEVERLADKLREMYNLSVSVYESRGWNIRVNYCDNSIDRLWKAIAPHIPQCYRYKVPKEYRDIPYKEYPYGKIEQKFVEVVLSDVVEIPLTKKNFPHGTVGFDIETETHNYFCGGILVHNSSMTVFHVGQDSPHYEHILEDQEISKLRGNSKLGKLWYKFKKAVGVEKAPKTFTGVCSRNIQLDIDDDNHFSSFVRENKMIEALEVHGLNIAVQGELIAPTIQGNYEKVDGFEYYVFDIFNIDKQEYMKPALARLITNQLGFKYVPVIGENVRLSDIYEGNDSRELVDAILAYAEGPGMNKGVKREGLVFKGNSTDFSMKAVSQSYLIKKEGN